MEWLHTKVAKELGEPIENPATRPRGKGASLPQGSALAEGEEVDDSPTELTGILEGAFPSPKGLGNANLTFNYVRDLDEMDIQQLQDTRIGSAAANLTKLRSSHHNLARILASGIKQVEAASLTGYSQSRISILKNDPAFKELMQFYATKAAETHENMIKRVASLGTDAMDMLQDRLDEMPESFTNSQLMELLKTCADRSNAPPVSKQISQTESRTVDVTVVRQIKEVIANTQNGQIISKEEMSNALARQSTTTIDAAVSEASPIIDSQPIEEEPSDGGEGAA